VDVAILTAMYPGTEQNSRLATFAMRQHGVLRRTQLDSVGVSGRQVARQLAARRWTAHGNNIVLCSNGAPTREQLKRIAVMDVVGPSALASHTALEQKGFRAFAKEAEDIHVLVQRGATYHRLPGVTYHESRRFDLSDTARIGGLPATRPARSAIDAAAWQPWPRFACAMLAAVVQQGLSTPPELDRTLGLVGRVRHKQHMRMALVDIASGAHTLGEADVATLCRRFHLRPPDRQRPRRDSSGRMRYLDCEWDLDDGTVLVLEVDGGHHRFVEHWEADMRRERRIVRRGRIVVRASNFELRTEQAALAADLRALGVPLVRMA
jgi:hypothetical protein